MLTNVTEHAEKDRHYRAITELSAYRERANSLNHDQIDAMLITLYQNWDDYIKVKHSGFISHVDELMYNQRYSLAESEINRFAADPSNMSPWMVNHLKTFTETIEAEKDLP